MPQISRVRIGHLLCEHSDWWKQTASVVRRKNTPELDLKFMPAAGQDCLASNCNPKLAIAFSKETPTRVAHTSCLLLQIKPLPTTLPMRTPLDLVTYDFLFVLHRTTSYPFPLVKSQTVKGATSQHHLGIVKATTAMPLSSQSVICFEAVGRTCGSGPGYSTAMATRAPLLPMVPVSVQRGGDTRHAWVQSALVRKGKGLYIIRACHTHFFCYFSLPCVFHRHSFDL